MVSRARLISQLINATGDVKSDYLDNVPVQDSAAIVSILPPQTSVYSTLDSLPVSGLTAGDRAFVESSGSGARLYISNGSGWYNVALINLSPTMTLDQSGTIALTAESLTSTVTITAVDSDNANLTYSVESDGNMLATGTTVSQDSSVFTITAASADSGGVAGSFDLTFKVTDGIGIDTEALSFTLQYSLIVDSSSATVLLMKAAGNSATNADITYQNSSDVSTGFTEYSSPQASTFSPYRSGGYSVSFDGTSDYLSVPAAAFALSTGSFTIETWVYFNSITTGAVSNTFQYMIYDARAGAIAQNHFMAITTSGDVRIRMDDIRTIELDQTLEAGTWYHLALVNNSGTATLYLDGTAQSTTFTTNDNLSIGSVVEIGGNTNDNNYWLDGYLRDFRVVIGTAVYTSNFTPPTEPLTAVSGTSLLCCHLPYFADGSTNDHTITTNGNTSTKPFGPYDYQPWAADDHGGSVYFDGVDDYIVAATTGNFGFGTGDFTIEMWVYADLTKSGDYLTSFGYNNQGINHSGPKFRYYHGTLGGTNVMYTTGATGYKYSWNHVAVTRESGTTRIFANGKQGASTTVSHSWPDYAIALGCAEAGSSAFMYDGYIADARYVKGQAIYTSNFTPPTAPLSGSFIAPASSVLHMQNKSDANVYDAAAANTFTLVSATSSTTQRKFSTSSSISTNSGYVHLLDIDNTNAFEFSTGDFCIEGWYYIPSGTQYVFFEGRDQQTQVAPLFYIYQSKLQLYVNGSFVAASSVLSNFAGTWCHLALDRYNGSTKGYFNGTAQWTYSDTNNYVATTDVHFGSYYGGTGTTANSYIQDVRVTKGYSRYKGNNFTPPTAEFEL